MSRRRWPLAVAALVVAVALVGAGWAAGRSSAPKKPAASDHNGVGSAGDGAAVRVFDGIPIGVQRSRAGALAAADNYVATSSETLIQDPERYQRFVRAVFTTSAGNDALATARRVRDSSPDTVAAYANGARGLTVIGARRLEAYDGATATVETWAGGIVWGPTLVPSQRWYLARTRLTWDGQRWRIQSLDELNHPGPAPAKVVVTGKDANRASAFDRELGGMEAPIYGTGG